MNALHDCVARLADGGPVDTVLHVGPADPALLERYLALWPRRVLWVDDDAERLVALRDAAAAAGASSVVELVPACVDTQAAERAWQRFDVPAFDGPLPLRDVSSAYPGLRAPETRRVTTRPLEALVAPALAALPPGARAVLALDQPGRERALLESLSPDTLSHVDVLVVRGCARPFFEGGGTLDETLDVLGRRSWRVRARGTATPWWPAVALQFDADVEALAAKLAASESARIAAEARHEEAAARALEHDAALRRELAEARQGLAMRDAALAEREAALRKELADVKQGLATRDATIADRTQELKRAAVQAHDAEAALRHELAEARQALSKRDTVLAQRDTTLAQRDEALARLREQEAVLRRDLAHMKEGVAARDESLAALEAGRAQAREQDLELRKELASLKAGVRLRDETLALRDAELKRREAELKRLEVEVASWRAELARRDQLHQATLEKAVAAERAGVQRAKDETAKVAQFRDTFKARVDELAAQLAEVVAARDTHLREKTALLQQREKQGAALSEAQKQIHRLEGAAQEAASRQRLLQDSLAKADGQLALVRDLLLRD